MVKEKIPVHVSIIPDGNRRWAKKNGFKVIAGHKKSSSIGNLVPLIEKARELGVGYISFWAFSTDNWNRYRQEINYLFELIKKVSRDFRKYAVKNKIRFRHLGRKDRLPKEVVRELEKAEKDTEEFNDFCVQICLDYGGRDEIIRAVNKLLVSGAKEIKEKDFSDSLDSAGIPDPDLIIRTSGERRTSGFMPYQSVYAELYFSDMHFPDFTPEELEKAIVEFGKRGRRFGK